MKNTSWIIFLFIKVIILILFIYFTLYKKEANLLYITIELLLFSFVNSFIIDNQKLKFDFEILSFQMITVFYFERLSIYNFREVSEDIFSNYNYIKLLFIVVFAAVFIFLTFRSKNKFLKVYFYCLFLSMIVIQNVFEIEALYLITIAVSLFEVALSNAMIDIGFISLLIYFHSRKNKKFLYIYFFIILSIFIRYITNTGGGI